MYVTIYKMNKICLNQCKIRIKKSKQKIKCPKFEPLQTLQIKMKQLVQCCPEYHKKDLLGDVGQAYTAVDSYFCHVNNSRTKTRTATLAGPDSSMNF